MGKYMRKSKTAGEVAVMEFSQSSLGVRTRARTLALQKSSSSRPVPPPLSDGGGGSYLQLRSRRLQKLPIMVIRSGKPKKQANKEAGAENPNPISETSNFRLNSGQGDFGPASIAVELSKTESQNVGSGHGKEVKLISQKDLGVEGSFGENLLEIEDRESRATRESTPCSLMRDPETIGTPGSTTKHNNSLKDANPRAQSSSIGHLPTAHEMDELFAGAEEEQQRHLLEKYNFDPVNDKPLPGRYEWKKIGH